MDTSWDEGKFKIRVGKMFVRSVTGDESENGQITGITEMILTSDEAKAKVFPDYTGAKSVYNKLSLGLKSSAQLERASD